MTKCHTRFCDIQSLNIYESQKPLPFLFINRELCSFLKFFSLVKQSKSIFFYSLPEMSYPVPDVPAANPGFIPSYKKTQLYTIYLHFLQIIHYVKNIRFYTYYALAHTYIDYFDFSNFDNISETPNYLNYRFNFPLAERCSRHPRFLVFFAVPAVYPFDPALMLQNVGIAILIPIFIQQLMKYLDTPTDLRSWLPILFLFPTTVYNIFCAFYWTALDNFLVYEFFLDPNNPYSKLNREAYLHGAGLAVHKKGGIRAWNLKVHQYLQIGDKRIPHQSFEVSPHDLNPNSPLPTGGGGANGGSDTMSFDVVRKLIEPRKHDPTYDYSLTFQPSLDMREEGLLPMFDDSRYFLAMRDTMLYELRADRDLKEAPKQKGHVGHRLVTWLELRDRVVVDIRQRHNIGAQLQSALARGRLAPIMTAAAAGIVKISNRQQMTPRFDLIAAHEIQNYDGKIVKRLKDGERVQRREEEELLRQKRQAEEEAARKRRKREEEEEKRRRKSKEKEKKKQEASKRSLLSKKSKNSTSSTTKPASSSLSVPSVRSTDSRSPWGDDDASSFYAKRAIDLAKSEPKLYHGGAFSIYNGVSNMKEIQKSKSQKTK